MSLTPKILAEGQLPAAKATLYTVPANTTTLVRFLRVYNTSASLTETVLITYKKGTSRVIARQVLSPNELADCTEEDVLSLDAGDLIEGSTTDATTVDYVISGAEAHG